MANSATAPSSKSNSSAPAGPPQDGQTFDTVMRGYERRQVDEALAAKNKEITRLKVSLAEANRQHQVTAETAERSDKELRELKARSAGSEPTKAEDSFGFRAEKLLRIAENEATEMRQNASKESSAILEKARTDAEKHRHDVEQTLITRASLLEQQAVQRSAELQEREQQIADQLAAARQQAEHLHGAAEQAALRLRKEAEAAADEARQRAESDVQRQRDQGTQELSRLTGLQSDVRSELARLTEVLTSELNSNGGAPPKKAAPAQPAKQEGDERSGASAQSSTSGKR
ncbi:hypothetical protein [Luteipulveratus mongoliensis]|uniref:Cellulose-binding protein n=1 Tax=Luteipulveratus mongoliensis TaxID=571913 RepID=A0A0K1JNL8_9MICO|nr:hypothetical protein [Luteipulveratus mongoliensis]AKU18296.1 hypothetical protein VV02_24720 [Luteipulveratus mongoliensis]